MKRKNLWRISVQTSLEAEDAVAELLGSKLETSASAYHNLESGISTVSAYFSDKKFLSRDLHKKIVEGLKGIKKAGLNLGAGKVETAQVKHEDWAESWKKHFHAMEIGDSLLIKPTWIKKRARKNQAVVVLDPGLSFGTGQHPTTSFCLGEIAKTAKTGVTKSFLDIGTGSGILAIAAAKLGFKKVEAFDFDPESIRVARTNIKANGVVQKIKIRRDDVKKLSARPAKKFDLVCANLISNLLVAEKKRIVAQMRRDGTLVLAGILAVEFLEVQRAFETLGLRLVTVKTENEWRSGSFRFK